MFLPNSDENFFDVSSNYFSSEEENDELYKLISENQMFSLVNEENAKHFDNICLDVFSKNFNFPQNDFKLEEESYINLSKLSELQENQDKLRKERSDSEDSTSSKQTGFPFLTSSLKMDDKSEFLQKKKGRKTRTNSNEDTLTNAIVHDKYSFDNILRKIKVLFHKFIINFLNKCIKTIYPFYNNEYIIKKIDGKKTQNITLSHNKQLLNSTLIDCLTMFMSKKYKKVSKEKNEEALNKIMSNSPILKEVFEIKYIDAYVKLFINEDVSFLDKKFTNVLNGLPTLSKCIEELKNTFGEETYSLKLNDIAKNNFIRHFLEKKSRRPRKSSNFGM